jgi:hypothetical protein
MSDSPCGVCLLDWSTPGWTVVARYATSKRPWTFRLVCRCSHGAPPSGTPAFSWILEPFDLQAAPAEYARCRSSACSTRSPTRRGPLVGGVSGRRSPRQARHRQPVIGASDVRDLAGWCTMRGSGRPQRAERAGSDGSIGQTAGFGSTQADRSNDMTQRSASAGVPGAPWRRTGGGAGDALFVPGDGPSGGLAVSAAALGRRPKAAWGGLGGGTGVSDDTGGLGGGLAAAPARPPTAPGG